MKTQQHMKNRINGFLTELWGLGQSKRVEAGEGKTSPIILGLF